jgi:hypothetical protein
MSGKTTSRLKLSGDAYRGRRFDVVLLMFPPHGHGEFLICFGNASGNAS